jgi:hypothetical protein
MMLGDVVRKMLAGICAVTLGLTLGCVMPCSAGTSDRLPTGDSAAEQAIDRQIQKIRAERGLEIHWRYSPDFIPPHWKTQWTGSPASVAQAEKMVSLCERWLSTWPDELTKVIKGIYIFDWLQMHGIKGVCIEYDFNLYLSSNMQDGDLLCRFFHEATHSLTRAVPLDATKWSSTLPKGVHYIGDEATKGNPLEVGDQYYRNGFLYKYSQSCADEEVAIIAQYLFTGPEELKRLMQKYPELRKRVMLAIDYFRRLSDEIDFSYFE